jgi:Cytochrome P450
MLIDETSRRYPSAPAITRTAIADDLVCGFRIRSGSTVLTSQWVMHGSPLYWEEPEKFELNYDFHDKLLNYPETWAIMPANPIGERFDDYWSAPCGAPLDERMVYVIRRHADARVVGMSTYYMALASQGGVEIGTTFLHPYQKRRQTQQALLKRPHRLRTLGTGENVWFENFVFAYFLFDASVWCGRFLRRE